MPGTAFRTDFVRSLPARRNLLILWRSLRDYSAFGLAPAGSPCGRSPPLRVVVELAAYRHAARLYWRSLWDYSAFGLAPSGVQIARTVDLSNPQLARGNNGAPYEITRRCAPRPYGVALRAIAAAARRRRTRSLSVPRGENGAPYGIRTHVPALRGPCPRPLDEGSGLADLWALGAQEGW
jgi:hypothetical protein